jgi:hypothetical protein
MRILIYTAAAAATLATALVTLPAQAAPYRTHFYAYDGRSGGFGSGPYWQGEPTDHRPIWRYGAYQGNDPDRFIRGQIMRDPTNDAHR